MSFVNLNITYFMKLQRFYSFKMKLQYNNGFCMKIQKITKKTIPSYYILTIQVKISMDCLLMFKHIPLGLKNPKLK